MQLVRSVISIPFCLYRNKTMHGETCEISVAQFYCSSVEVKDPTQKFELPCALWLKDVELICRLLRSPSNNWKWGTPPLGRRHTRNRAPKWCTSRGRGEIAWVLEKHVAFLSNRTIQPYESLWLHLIEGMRIICNSSDYNLGDWRPLF